MDTNNNASTNQQDHPHREGQTMNTASQQGAGQKGNTNNSQGMSDMLNESDEQRAGQGHGQRSERDVQQEERQP